MYVAVKGGERAIENSHALIAEERRGDPRQPELTLAQIEQQMGLAVDRVMTEGSLYDRELAALALKQARGDAVEAIFLLRAYRTTLPRLATSEPIDTARMAVRRRISAAFKDLPGGQLLGPTYDYTHRLLDFTLAGVGPTQVAENTEENLVLPRKSSPQVPTGEAARHAGGQCDPGKAVASGQPVVDPVHAGARQEGNGDAPAAPMAERPVDERLPRVTEILGGQGLIEPETSTPSADENVADITRRPARYPADRAQRLQQLARGDEGWLLALGYSTQRGFGGNHPFAGEIRMGEVTVELVPEELGFAIEIGEITVTECQMINQFAGSKDVAPQFTRGYGLAFGHSERKTMGMALVDRALRARDLGEDVEHPAQDEEFVLAHADNVEASGFVQHLKLPHYVDFQSELVLLRGLRRERGDDDGTPETAL